ncbi:MAG: YraN family protein [Candidatus Krumholzibacteriota bacterium]|nr:YraN family protein [Candidatus Krumholzibacteriota bacterium]
MRGLKELGSRGEKIAAEYLCLRGYEIIQRNFRTGHLEIDLIAARQDCLAFIEVKTRRGDSFGGAVEGVSRSKVKNLREAAHRFYASGNSRVRYGETRFDLIAIDLDRSGQGMVLRHLKGIA